MAEIISVTEAARRKDTTSNTIYAWLRAGRINEADGDGGRSGIVVDEKFHRAKAIGYRGKQKRSATIEEIREIEARLQAIEKKKAACIHAVSALPSKSGKIYARCSKCSRIGPQREDAVEAVNAFWQEVTQ